MLSEKHFLFGNQDCAIAGNQHSREFAQSMQQDVEKHGVACEQ
jgi:hypothetical protein